MANEVVGLPTLVWQIQFLNAKPGSNSTFKPPPVDIGSEHVRDLGEIPEWVSLFAIHQVVRCRVRVDGEIRSLDTPAFSIKCYKVHREFSEALTAEANGRHLVRVPEAYIGKLRVSASPDQSLKLLRQGLRMGLGGHTDAQ